MLRYFRRRGLLDEVDADGMLGWQGSGGFSIDASVRIQGDDREGVERLIRYCARPPFALERLHAPNGAASLNSPDARLLYRFPKLIPDGRTQILLTPLQLLERLARFVPPPRIHRNRYHGVLAPNAKLRPAVVAIGRPQADAPDADILFSAAYRPDAGVRRLWNLPSAELLTSDYAIEEARRNLREPEQLERLDRLLQSVTNAPAMSFAQEMRADIELREKDWPILGGAVTGGATHLITSDLRDFGRYFSTQVLGVLIIPPADYINSLCWPRFITNDHAAPHIRDFG